MIVKIVILFLIGMAVLAMFGRLRYPGRKRRRSAECARCGMPRVGPGPCRCGEP